MKKFFLIQAVLFVNITMLFAQGPITYATNAIRWYNSIHYQMDMHNDASHHYGPVTGTGHSIKSNMLFGQPTWGWTWGSYGKVPIAALNTEGHMKIAGNFEAEGNVGIGKAVTSMRLDVNGSARFGADGQSGIIATGFGSYSTLVASGANSNGLADLLLLTKSFNVKKNGFANLFTVLNNGDVKVTGDILVPSDKYIRFGSDNPNTGQLTISNASCCYNTYMHHKGNLYISPDGNGQGVGFQKDGTVTIGVWEKYEDGVVDTQGHKLMVNGGILCEKLKVIGDVPNSDYVFEKKYNLKSLEEVDSFIKLNKHLPEVPSAKCFAEDGYNVGEMDDLLLRKVEELTLYIIELNKEMGELRSQITKGK